VPAAVQRGDRREQPLDPRTIVSKRQAIGTPDRHGKGHLTGIGTGLSRRRPIQTSQSPERFFRRTISEARLRDLSPDVNVSIEFRTSWCICQLCVCKIIVRNYSSSFKRKRNAESLSKPIKCIFSILIHSINDQYPSAFLLEDVSLFVTQRPSFREWL